MTDSRCHEHAMTWVMQHCFLLRPLAPKMFYASILIKREQDRICDTSILAGIKLAKSAMRLVLSNSTGKN